MKNKTFSRLLLAFAVLLGCVSAAVPIDSSNNSLVTKMDYAFIAPKIYAENLTAGDVVGYSYDGQVSKIFKNTTMYSVVSGRSMDVVGGNINLISETVYIVQGNITVSTRQVKTDFTNWNWTAVTSSGMAMAKVSGTCTAGDWVVAVDNSGYGQCKTVRFGIDALKLLLPKSNYAAADVRAFLTNVINFFIYQQTKVCTAMTGNTVGNGYVVCAFKGM